MNIIIGTAGHIDHGKTSLVFALTGVDADRLPEEKQRGITIDLGFAELTDGETRLGFVDVPGHERFVKNMLAGASGIDAVALVIAADEGVMPQTREHFEICRLLDTRHGIVILTKKDLVEDEFVELVKADAAALVKGSFLEDAPVIAVSSKTGDGVDKVRESLLKMASRVSQRRADVSTKLPVDRVFSVKGFGAVVTGTLASGEISEGDEMELLPDGRKVRVRGLQTHGKSVKNAKAGQRTAVNLGGIDHSEIERGVVLAEPGAFSPTQIVDCRVEVLKDAARPLRSRQRVRVHFGTVEVLARAEVLNEKRAIDQGEKDFLQLRFEKPVVGLPLERFILRQYSPQITIAGGIILDAHAKKRRRSDLAAVRSRLVELADRELPQTRRIELLLEPYDAGGCSFEDLRCATGLKAKSLRSNLDAAVKEGLAVETEGIAVAASEFGSLLGSILEKVGEHHKKEPLSKGIARETLREKTAANVPVEVFRKALETLQSEGKINAARDVVASGGHTSELSADEQKTLAQLSKLYSDAGLQVPSLGDAIAGCSVPAPHARKIFQLLIDSGEVVRISEDYYFSRDSLDKLVADIRNFAETEAENRLISVPEFKQVANVSRKYAIPLLEYFDGAGITRRAGDKRLVL